MSHCMEAKSTCDDVNNGTVEFRTVSIQLTELNVDCS